MRGGGERSAAIARLTAMKTAPLLAGVLLLAACDAGDVNPPTRPARPVDTAEQPDAPPLRPPGLGPLMPGAGPESFVGKWAARVEWCASPQGDRQPIEITTTRFQGYENSCAIDTVDQVANGYEAALTCQSEGATRRERVRMEVDGPTMRLTYIDRGGAIADLRKCTRLDDTVVERPGA